MWLLGRVTHSLTLIRWWLWQSLAGSFCFSLNLRGERLLDSLLDVAGFGRQLFSLTKR